MSGDYSRQRFDPFNDFSGVLMQQGRVQLDADWNELVDIIERRLRTETTDIIGRATVPRETPDAFAITFSAGVPRIGPGRIYVDGLLAENHGAEAPREFDTVLAELRGTVSVAYNDQTYFPNAGTAAPFPTTGGPHLVYLDVWQREVTYLEEPGLEEIAVAVDTTTRYQTAWQVRVLSNVGAGVTCDTPDNGIPGWSDVRRPSDGRLSTAAVGVPEDDDPCLTPPSGGFKGLENRLYRVEIHDSGPRASATFKWSRDNASVATAVTAIPNLTNLTVARVGRDAVLRFSAGDWVEITDDWREYAGDPGIIARVQGVNDATRTITLATALPAGVFPTDAFDNTEPERHTRIKRWDQKGQVSDTDGNLLVDLDLPGAAGVIPLPAEGGSVVLEDGVQVTFHISPAGGEYHAFDYWVFGARTADASVEALDHAPPRGVHHHYSRLGVVTLPADVEDCRTLWPPEFGEAGCECTVCVTPEIMAKDPDALQKAVNLAGEAGGTICLSAGNYPLKAAIVLDKLRSVEIHGRGQATQIIAAGAAFRLLNGQNITLRDFYVASAGKEPAVIVKSGLGVSLRRLMLEVKSDLPAVSLIGTLSYFELCESWFESRVGIAAQDPTQDKTATLKTEALLIAANLFDCKGQAINLDGASHLGLTRIVDNLAVGTEQAAISLLGSAVASASVNVTGNLLLSLGDGIVASGNGLRIEDNDIDGVDKRPGANGIVLQDDAQYKAKAGEIFVLGNRINNRKGGGISIQAPIGSGMVKNNTVAMARAGIVFEERGWADSLSIENNQVLDVTSQEEDKESPAVGIRVVGSRLASVVNNTVRRVGLRSVKEGGRVAIQVLGCEEVRITGNDISQIGPDTEFIGPAIGVHVLQPFHLVNVCDNLVNRDLETAAYGPGPWTAVLIGFQPSDALDLVKIDKNLLILKIDQATYVYASGAFLKAQPTRQERVDLRGNVVNGSGTTSGVIVMTSGEGMLSDNRCEHMSGQPAMVVQAEFAIVSANRVFGPEQSLVLNVDPKRSTVLGNITGQPIDMKGPLTAPWLPLNVVA